MEPSWIVVKVDLIEPLEPFDFDTVKWSTSMLKIGPPPPSRSILLDEAGGCGNEEEREGGAIRADSEGVRVRHRDDQGGCAKAWRSPPDGAPGADGCAAAGAQADGRRAAGGGTADSLHRRRAGSRPQGAAQTAS